MYFLGIDVGSVSTDFVVMNEAREIVRSLYLKTKGNPIEAIREGMACLGTEFSGKQIEGVGVTGSGRALVSAIVGADIAKNEITAQGTAAAAANPDVRTVIEIGGQDSKIILLENGLVRDFAMNTVCAAGTGSFLDRQAERIGVGIEELGKLALASQNPVRIAGRCAVFAESDLIHKQQLGCAVEDIIAGMCRALVRNYLSNVAKGKKIRSLVCFQGGVAANEGIRAAFEAEMGEPIFVPEGHKVMGAWGIAILAQEKMKRANGTKTKFKGFEAVHYDVTSRTFECKDCSNECEVVILYVSSKAIGCFADRCGKHQRESASKSSAISG